MSSSTSENVTFASQQEPIIPHAVPSGPWEKVGIDLFQDNSHDYPLLEDYFSNLPLVMKLSNQTVSYVLSLLKAIFPEHGIQAYVFTDVGRQLTSAEFQEFTRCY